MGTLDVVTVSESWRTPVSTSVSPFLTLIEPVSNFLTLNVFCIPHPEISTDLVTEEIEGLNAKVTKPLSSILSTFAPNVIPAVPSSAVHVTTPSSVVWVNPVTTVSPTLMNPSFLKGLPIVAEVKSSSAVADPEERIFGFSPRI